MNKSEKKRGEKYLLSFFISFFSLCNETTKLRELEELKKKKNTRGG